MRIRNTWWIVEDLGAISREVRAMIVQPLVAIVSGPDAAGIGAVAAVAAFVKVRRTTAAANDGGEERGSSPPAIPMIQCVGDAALESSNDGTCNGIS